MTEAERIADQHRRAFDGEAWHGPHLFSLLDGVDAKTAARKPVAGAHSIWEIVRHIHAWEDVVLRRLGGERVSLTEAEDWPPVADPSPAAWKRDLDSLREVHGGLVERIGSLPDSRLLEASPGSRTTLYQLLHGQVQHALYHAGQIAILKKP